MTDIARGQQAGREARIRETQNWLGAKLLTPDGRPTAVTEKDDPQEYLSHLQQIRSSIAAGVKRVVVCDRDKDACDTLRSLLTPYELARVEFIVVAS